MLEQNLVEFNKKAQVQIFVVIFLIVISLVAVILIFNLSYKIIKKSPQDFCPSFLNSVSIKKACYLNNEEVKIILKRNFNYDFKKIRVLFNPSNSIWEISGKKCKDVRLEEKNYGNFCSVILEGEEKSYVINTTDLGKQEKIVLFVGDEKFCFVEEKIIEDRC